MAKSITLLIPGLLDHLPDPAPNLPALKKLMARGYYRSDVHVGYERTLMDLFSQPQSTERDVPVGALSRYAQTGEKPEGVWLCAAPVHLFADQSRVYLNAIDEPSLSESESQQLLTELNNLYKEDGWEFVQHTSTRWYLHIPEQPNIRTTPLHVVKGKPIHDKLPQGPDALEWHRVLNEMQMLFHASPVNQEREERGESVVNGVWLWGAGVLPEASEQKPWKSVWTNLPMAKGLALLNGNTLHDVPEIPEPCIRQSEQGAQLIVFTHSRDEFAPEWIEQLEREWFAPLVELLSIWGKMKKLFSSRHCS